MKQFFFILVFIFISISKLSAQKFEKTDSLKQIGLTQTDTVQLATYIKVVKSYLPTNLDSATFYANQSVFFAKKLDNTHWLGEAFYISGLTEMRTEKFDSAKKQFTRSQNYFQQSGYKYGLVRIYEKLGVIYLRQTNYSKATECFINQLHLSERLKNKGAIAGAENNLASVFMNEKHYELALQSLTRALNIYHKIGNLRGEGLTLNNIGEIYKYQTKYIEAANYYVKSLHILTQLNSPSDIAYCLNNIGENYFFRQELDSALLYLNNAKKRFSKLGDHFGLAEVYNNLGEIYFAKSDDDKAELYLKKSTNFASLINSKSHIKDNKLLLSEIYFNKKDFLKAYLNLKEYGYLKDSIYNLKNQKIINELKINYETEKKEREITELNVSAKLREKEILVKENTNLALIIGISIVLIFLFFVLIQKRKTNQAYKALVEKNLEIMKSEKELKTTKADLEEIIEETKVTVEHTTKQLKEIEQEDVNTATKNTPTFEKYNSNISEDKKDVFLLGLKKLMENDTLYLDKNVNIKQIAKLLDTNKLYISRLINENFEQNFNNYINSYRIKYARELLSDPKSQLLSIEGIGYTVGFNTKSTFYNAFKKVTGITPSFFRASVLENSIEKNK